MCIFHGTLHVSKSVYVLCVHVTCIRPRAVYSADLPHLSREQEALLCLYFVHVFYVCSFCTCLFMYVQVQLNEYPQQLLQPCLHVCFMVAIIFFANAYTRVFMLGNLARMCADDTRDNTIAWQPGTHVC
jgi:hypothetical protein